MSKIFGLLAGFLFLLIPHLSLAQNSTSSCLCPPSPWNVAPGGKYCTEKVTTQPISPAIRTPIVRGDHDSSYLDQPNFYYLETTNNKNLPFDTGDANYPVYDSTRVQLTAQTFPNSAGWQSLVQGATSTTIQGNATGVWFSKTFCLNNDQDDHEVFFIGGDNEWQVVIDGQIFAECLNKFYCFTNGLFLGREILAGNHFIQIKYLNYSLAGTLWFDEFSNTGQEVMTQQPSSLNVQFSSNQLLGKSWDYSATQPELCPPGYSFDSCNTNLCAKYINQPCNVFQFTASAQLSCSDDQLGFVNPYNFAIKGNITAQELPSGQTFTSSLITIPANSTPSFSLFQLFGGQGIAFDPGKSYQLGFIPSNLTPPSITPPANVTVTMNTTGCGGMTVTPSSQCGDPITVMLNDPYPASGVAQWTLHALEPTGARILPALASQSETYSAGHSWNESIYDLFSQPQLATLLSNSAGGSWYELDVTLSNSITGSSYTVPSKNFKVMPLAGSITVIPNQNQPNTSNMSNNPGVIAIYAGIPVQLELEANALTASSASDVQWSITDGSPSSGNGNPFTTTWDQPTADPAGVPISAKVKLPNGCEIVAQAQVVADVFNGPWVPSAFTPSASTNRLFKPDGQNIDWDYFRVYNRFGQMVYNYQGGGEPEGWDGTLNGVLQDTGTFVWTGRYRDHDATAKPWHSPMKGTVVLIR